MTPLAHFRPDDVIAPIPVLPPLLWDYDEVRLTGGTYHRPDHGAEGVITAAWRAADTGARPCVDCFPLILPLEDTSWVL